MRGVDTALQSRAAHDGACTCIGDDNPAVDHLSSKCVEP